MEWLWNKVVIRVISLSQHNHKIVVTFSMYYFEVGVILKIFGLEVDRYLVAAQAEGSRFQL